MTSSEFDAVLIDLSTRHTLALFSICERVKAIVPIIRDRIGNETALDLEACLSSAEVLEREIKQLLADNPRLAFEAVLDSARKGRKP
jgi:hypothetical protein